MSIREIDNSEDDHAKALKGLRRYNHCRCRYDSIEYNEISAKEMFDDLKSKLSPDQKTYLFPDEIQEIKVWDKVVKYTFDNV